MSLQSECGEVCKLDVECGSLVIFATMTMVVRESPFSTTEQNMFSFITTAIIRKLNMKTLQYLAVDS